MTGPLIQAAFRFVLDEKTSVVSVSEEVESLLGIRAEDFANCAVKLNDRIHGDDSDIAKLLFSPSNQKEQGIFNLRLRHADGKIRCVRGEYSKTPGVARAAATLDLLLEDARSIWKSTSSEPMPPNFRALLENTRDFIFFKDRNHVFTRVSRNLPHPAGGTGGDASVLGRTDYDLFPEKYADICYRLEKDIFAGMPVASAAQEVHAPDGRVVWLDNHVYPILGEDEAITGVFGLVLDVTERKKAQLALEAQERDYSAIFDCSVEGIVRVTIDGHVLLANRAAASILGYDSTEEALAAINHAGRDAWVDPAEREEYLRKLIESEDHRIAGFECRLKRRDGSALWVLLNGRLAFGDDGQPAYAEVFFVDINDRKQAAETLRASEESLRQAQAIAGFGSYVGDLNTGDWTSSEMLDDLMGIDKDYEHTKEGWIARVHPDDRAMMAAYFMDEILGQKKAFNKNYRIIRKSDGAVRWVEDRGELEYDALGRPVKMHGMVRDITETKLFEAALRESADTLKEAQRIAELGSYKVDLAAGRWTSSEVLDGLFGIDKEYDRSIDGWAAIVHPDDRAMMTSYFAEEVLGMRKPFDKEYRIVRPSDGAVRWVHGRGRLEIGEDGVPLAMHGTIRDVTERKESVIALRESEESLREAQRIAGIGSFEVDLATDIATRSKALNQVLGIDDDFELRKDSWLTLTHPDDRAAMKAHIDRVVRGDGSRFDHDYRIVRPSDGAVRWIHSRGRVEFDSNGRPIKLRGTMQDITERKQADAALRQSKELLQLFITHAPASLAMLDREMRYLAVSRRWLETNSLSGQDVIGKSHYEVFPGLPEAWLEEHRSALGGVSIPAREGLLEPLDGSERWLRREIIPWRTSDGGVGGIILFSDDITWRKQAEAALRESNERLQLFIETAPVSLAMFDREMRYLMVSNQWAKMIRKPAKMLIGRCHYDISPGMQERWREKHRRGLAGERQHSDEDLYDHGDGVLRWIRWEVIPWKAADGSVGGIVVFIENITQRKQAEAALRANTNLLEMFMKRAPAALAMFDREMRYLHASDRWREDYNLAGKEIIGHCHYEISPDIPERWRELHRRGLAGETLSADEDSYVRADGTVRWVRWEVMPWRAGDGAVGGIILFAEDITHQKESAERLRLAASVFTNAREGIMITDAAGNILEVNEMFTQITGYSREESLGKNPSIFKSGLQGNEFYRAMWNLLLEEGQWSGEIWNRKKNGDIYAQTMTINAVRGADGAVLEYVALFSDVTELKEQERKLELVTHYDVLTGLPNRTLLADRLRQAMALPSQQDRLLAVAYLDLDNFKEINDRFGHSAGDRLLTALAFNMRCALRKGDTLARLGGDEFGAVLLDLIDVEASVPILNRLLEAAAETVQVSETSLQLTASMGVAYYRPKDKVDADSLLRQADQAMYQAKLTGGNRSHVYDPDRDQLVRGRHENLEHIRNALSAREFVLYYQPKVNMRTGKVVGAEALIRWQHPQRGLLPPGMFLPVIEEDPLAVELGEWVIDAALAQLEAWKAMGFEIPISVNVGALQLQQPDFVGRLSILLAAHPNVNPRNLELEVVETSALQDVAQTSQVMNACREIGVAFALDDFGTGYSSLTYLKRLPVDMLKIDQSFVRDMLEDPENLNILEGVLGLASAFHRGVIAEGVETVEHGLMLLQLGCELAQGYGIARPMPAVELPGWASEWRPDPRWAGVPPLNAGNRALLYACVDHRAWVEAFEDYLQGRRQAPQALDEHQCRLGIWLDSEKKIGRAKDKVFQPVKKVHRQFHELTEEIFTSMNGGRESEGLGRLGELHRLRDEMQQHLEVLQQRC